MQRSSFLILQLFRVFCAVLAAGMAFGPMAPILEAHAAAAPSSASLSTASLNPRDASTDFSDAGAAWSGSCLKTDLKVTKTDGLEEVASGADTTYTIRVTNLGPSSVDGAVLSDVLGDGLVYKNSACSTAAGNQCNPDNLTPDKDGNLVLPLLDVSQFYEILLTVNVTAPAGSSVTNTAKVAVPAGMSDSDPSNNEASDTDTVPPVSPPSADLSVTKTDGVTSVHPNGTVSYTIVVANAGPDAANGAIFKDPAVAGINVTAVSCGTPTGGAACPTVNNAVSDLQGAGIVIPTFPSGGSLTFTLAATITAVSGSVTNTTTIAPPSGVTDHNLTNNSATDTDTVTPVADLSITKTDGVTSVNPNASVSYAIVVVNAGPDAADGAILKDLAVTGINVTGVSCGTPTGGAACPTVNNAVSDLQGAGIVIPTFPSGGSLTFTLTATITAASGDVTNTVTIAPPSGVTDPNLNNNTATDTDTVTPVADLSVTKTDGVTRVNPNTGVSYAIVVANAGPDAANGAIFKDPAVAGINVTGVSCGTPTGGAACPTVNNAVSDLQGAGIVIPTFPSGGSLTFTLAATITAVSGSVTNTTTIAPPSGVTDPNLNNNTATDTDQVNEPVPPPLFHVWFPIINGQNGEGTPLPVWDVGLGYEDMSLMSGQADYDFNDWIVDIHGDIIDNPVSSTMMQQIDMSFLPRARGAAFNHKFEIRIPAQTFASNGTATLTLSDGNHKVLSTQKLTFVHSVDSLFVIFPQTSDIFSAGVLNTIEGKGPAAPNRFADLSIVFDTPFAFSVNQAVLSLPRGEGLFFDPILKVLNTGEEVHRGDVRLLSVPYGDWLWSEEGVRIDRSYPMVTFIPGNPPSITFPDFWWSSHNHCVYDQVACGTP